MSSLVPVKMRLEQRSWIHLGAALAALNSVEAFILNPNHLRFLRRKRLHWDSSDKALRGSKATVVPVTFEEWMLRQRKFWIFLRNRSMTPPCQRHARNDSGKAEIGVEPGERFRVRWRMERKNEMGIAAGVCDSEAS